MIRFFLHRPFLFLCIFLIGIFYYPKASFADYCGAGSAPPIIMNDYESVRMHIEDAFENHKKWLVDEFFTKSVLPSLMQMTEQLSAVAMQQVAAIGMFMDAKQQLENQRLFQELQNEAHKDYQPSEDFCVFGTNVRNLAAAEELGQNNVAALNAIKMNRQLANVNSAGADSRDNEKLGRWKKFTQIYCDPKDNNGQMAIACGAGGTQEPERLNIDINYTKLIDNAKTLAVNFFDNTSAQPTPDEQDVMALSSNLFGHDVLTRNVNSNFLDADKYQKLYMALRSVAAKRNVAQSSFNEIIGLKSASAPQAQASNNRQFLGAIMSELGVPETEIEQTIGTNPSYYAQLEILAKRIYQNPDFYSNLYDKPVNVERKMAALKAIDLMLDRAIYESQLRQEMTMSVLLSAKLQSAGDSGKVNQ